MDDDDKARRNLVVASALVIASAWLEIPFSSVIQKFVDYSVSTPDSNRVLAAGLAILAYLGLRYRASDEGQIYAKEIEGHTYQIRLKRTKWMVERHLNKFQRSGIQPKFIKTDLKLWLTAHNSFLSIASVASPRSKFEVDRLRYSNDNLIEVDARLGNNVFKNPASKLGGVEVVLTGLRKRALSLEIQAELWCTSLASIRYLVPVAMACTATAILIFKVGFAYWLAS